MSKGPPCDLLACLHLCSRFHSRDPGWPPRCLPCQLARDCSPPLAALSLSGWPEQAGMGSLPGTLLPATADKCGLFFPLARPS